MPKFSEKSAEKLNTCHPDLVRLFQEVVKYFDCTILEGMRGRERQERFFREGKGHC
jgi:peptidoglycan L-alanyl-D-glutamate endopeptidase CwlK